MQYKTMALELLRQRPQRHEQLRQEHKLLEVMEEHAMDLKARHEAWIATFSQTTPPSDPSQVSGAALEMALKELEDCLDGNAPPAETDENLSLDVAMAFLKRPSSRE